MRALTCFSLMVLVLAGSIQPLHAQNEGRVGQMFQKNPRFVGRIFHIFAIFDEVVDSSAQDKVLLTNLFKQFNRDFTEDAQEAKKPLPSNFQVVPLDSPAQPGVPRVGFCILQKREQITPEAVGAAIKQFGRSVKKGDIVFSYINCHGKRVDDVDYLLLGGKMVPRDKLRDDLLFLDSAKSQRTHLTVFVTDNCRVNQSGPENTEAPKPSAIWKSLYFAHQGIVDLTSTTDGAPAVTIGQSLFLRAFVNTFTKGKFPKDTDDAGQKLLAANSNDPNVLRLINGVVPWQEQFERVLKMSMAEVVEAQKARLDEAKVDTTKLVPKFLGYPRINDVPANAAP
jgi:hypothetical protein